MNIFDNELDFAFPNNEGFQLHIARTRPCARSSTVSAIVPTPMRA